MNEYSEFYLERVGHEGNGKLRQKLKNGKNLVGRIDSKGVSIGVDSLFCSRRHCVITVYGNSVDIKDLNVRLNLSHIANFIINCFGVWFTDIEWNYC